MADLRTLDSIDVKAKRVLVRADLNVPMEHGRVANRMRIEGAVKTIKRLSEAGAKVIVLSHLGRPDGEVVAKLSLKPLAPALAEAVGRAVGFSGDCVGVAAQNAVTGMKDGEILLLENTRFHPGEEKNDPEFVARLARLGDIFVNDAFSVSHRAHATTVGLARALPSVAGSAMQAEIEHLEKILGDPGRPMTAMVGGAKVSGKIALLEHLLTRIDRLVIGGAMASTFLAAGGMNVGASLVEPEHFGTARRVLSEAAVAGVAVILPADLVVAHELRPRAAFRTVAVKGAAGGGVGPDEMILDVGRATIETFEKHLHNTVTLIWNGPLGAFETPPFDAGTTAAARLAAAATKAGRLFSVAGGGDTVSALSHAGVIEDFSYVSAAGGAFLQWLEGQELPGVEELRAHKG